MSAGKRRRSRRDEQRRSLGQNFLVDRSLVGRLIRSLEIVPGELVVEPGAGSGALTVPLARAGARVTAVEADRHWAERLSRGLRRAGLADQVEVVIGDLLTLPLPAEPYRVIANPPFGLTTALLARLLDEPSAGPDRVDLVVQAEVATKRAATPATTLRSAAWAPWWEVALGLAVPRRAFRPVPAVDAAVLSYRRRQPALLPERLAPGFIEMLRPAWDRSS